MEGLRAAAGVGRTKRGTAQLVFLLLRVWLIHGKLARVHHHPFHFMVGGVAPARGSPARRAAGALPAAARAPGSPPRSAARTRSARRAPASCTCRPGTCTRCTRRTRSARGTGMSHSMGSRRRVNTCPAGKYSNSYEETHQACEDCNPHSWVGLVLRGGADGQPRKEEGQPPEVLDGRRVLAVTVVAIFVIATHQESG